MSWKGVVLWMVECSRSGTSPSPWNAPQGFLCQCNNSIDSPIHPLSVRDPDGQPNLSVEQEKVSPIWRRPVFVNPSFGRHRSPPRRIFPWEILQHVVTDCSLCASISVCLEHGRRFGSLVRWNFASLYILNSSRWSLQNQLCTTHQQAKQGKTRLRAPKKVVMMFGFSSMAHGAGYLLKLSWNRSTDLLRQIGKKNVVFSPDIILIGPQLSMTSCHFILPMEHLCAWQSFLPRHRRMSGLRGTHYGLVI